MKKYLDKTQTEKLINLGFDDGRSKSGDTIPAYSIGELIDLLPNEITDEYDEVMSLEFSKTEVYYTNFRTMSYYKNSAELIDALFDMCVTLKEEGVI